MGKSGSAESPVRGLIPRWFLLVPLIVSFCAMQADFWDLDAPRRLESIRHALGWTFVVFPHAFAVALLPLGTPVAMMIVAAIDIALWVFIWRTQPPRLTARRLCTILVVWIALSAGLTFATPYLMIWTWQIGR